MFLLAGMDAIAKHMTETLAVPQILAIRFWVFLLFALVLAQRAGFARTVRICTAGAAGYPLIGDGLSDDCFHRRCQPQAAYRRPSSRRGRAAAGHGLCSDCPRGDDQAPAVRGSRVWLPRRAGQHPAGHGRVQSCLPGRVGWRRLLGTSFISCCAWLATGTAPRRRRLHRGVCVSP